MDPITLAILASAAGSAAGTLPSLIPTSADRENKERLKKLQALEASGGLGLTGSEEALLARQRAGSIQAAAAQSEAERNRLLAGSGGATAGGALLGAQLADEQKQLAAERAQTEIMAIDEEKKRRQIEEMRALEAQRGERQRQAVAAGGAILGSALEGGVTAAAQNQLFQGGKAPSPDTVNSIAKSLGVSESEARGFLELSVTNPEVAKYMLIARGK